LTRCTLLEIINIIKNTQYDIIEFFIDDKSFGNIVLVIDDGRNQVRFIQDRGDIYAERRAKDHQIWNKLSSPQIPYDIGFLQAIKLFVNNNPNRVYNIKTAAFSLIESGCSFSCFKWCVFGSMASKTNWLFPKPSFEFLKSNLPGECLVAHSLRLL
jgi:hypothetical protein